MYGTGTSEQLHVIGYVRVSTDKQDLGPEVQVAALQAEAARRGWLLDIRQEQAANAKSLRGRPVLAQAPVDRKAGHVDALAVSKLDRLSRNVADFARLLEDADRQRWHVLCLDLGVDTTTITGRAMAQVTATFAEMERRRISERAKDAMRQLPDDVRDRVRHGGRPRAIAPTTVARVHQLRAQGLTFQAIADQLTAEGVPTTTGGPWWPGTVRRLARRDQQAAA